MTVEEAIAQIIELYAKSVGNIPEYERKKYGEAIAKLAMSCNGYSWPFVSYRDADTLPNTLRDYQVICSDNTSAVS